MRTSGVTGVLATGGLLLALLLTLSSRSALKAAGGTIPPLAPVLLNPEFECADGYTESVNDIGQTIRIPVAWRYRAVAGSPKANSARIQFTGSCDGSGHVERIGREDSFVLRAQDLETPPEPGKPFDSVLLQQVAVVPGGDYSLSGWLLTLCGGSALPNDCPDGFYMAKMLGLDPTGGQEPDGSSVVWMENRNNFVSPDGERIGWQNLSINAVAQAMTMTLFARIQSPFQWHGNHGFVDSLSFVRAPVAALEPLPAETTDPFVMLTWTGEQSPDVAAIPGGAYRLLFDLQVRPAGGEWRAVVTGADGAGALPFVAPCLDLPYEFRLRARAEQPEDDDGAWPNQRYLGSWNAATSVVFHAQPSAAVAADLTATTRIFLPLIRRDVRC